MIVTCHKCQTKFRVRPEVIRPEGTTLRCSRCGSVFRAAPPRAAKRPAGPPPGVTDEDYILYGGPPPQRRDAEASPRAERNAEPEGPEVMLSGPAVVCDQPLEQPQPSARPIRPRLPQAEAPHSIEPHAVAPRQAAPRQAAIEVPEPVAPAPRPQREPEAIDAAPLAQAVSPAEATNAAQVAEAPRAEPSRDPMAQAPATDIAQAPVGDEPWPEMEQRAAAAPPPPPPPPRRAPASAAALPGWRRALNSRSPLALGVLGLAAVLVVGLFAWRMGFIGGEKVDPEGRRQISFTGISGYFLKNNQDGIVYVVQGLARNGYHDRRGRIRIKAALYDAMGKQVHAETIYAGSVFTREELQRLPLKDISARLGGPTADTSSALVRPGATVPFMAVFGDLPASLGEFSLEAASSSRAASS